MTNYSTKLSFEHCMAASHARLIAVEERREMRAPASPYSAHSHSGMGRGFPPTATLAAHYDSGILAWAVWRLEGGYVG